MALRPGGAKAKGADGEREAAALLAEWALEVGVTLDPTRNLEQTRGGGYDLNGVPGLGIEVKRVEANNINSWWKQTVRQADADGTIPFLIHRKNRQKWNVRVRTLVAFYGAEKSGTASVVVDLTIDQAKAWFQHYVYYTIKEHSTEKKEPEQ